MKILVNLPTFYREEIFPPWLRIFKVFQSYGNEVLINTGLFIKKLDKIEEIYNFRSLSDNEKKILSREKIASKADFLLHSLKRNFFLLKERKNILRNIQFDVVYTPSAVLDFVIFPYWLKIRERNILWATTVANTVPITDPGNRLIRFSAWLFFRISIFMVRKADVIFASTPEIVEYLLSAGFDKEKIILTGFGVESDYIKNAECEKKYNFDSLFVGRINETKGIFDMLKVLQIVKRRYPDFQFAVMGSGDKTTMRKLREEIKKEKLETNIRFLGYKIGKEKYNIIRSVRSFWFLSVSKSESFGIALLEAVCSGIPAFAYDLPQFSWLYPNGEVNISPKGDYKLVAEKVIKLFEKGDFINEKGKMLLGKYSWEKIAEIEYRAINTLISK